MKNHTGLIWLVVFTVPIISVHAENSEKTLSLNQTQTLSSSNNSIINAETPQTNSTERRRSRQLQINRIELPFSGTQVKKHLVKIPPNVSRVKVIGTTPVARPRKLLHRRISTRMPESFYPSDSNSNWNLPQNSDEFEYDRMDTDSLPPSAISNDLRTNSRKNKGPEPNYDYVYDENSNLGLGHYFSKEDPIKYGKFRLAKRPIKAKRKIPNEAFYNHGGRFVQPTHSDDKEYTIYKNRFRGPDRDEPGYYDYDHIEPIRYSNQLPSTTYALKTKYSPDLVKQPDKPVYGKYYQSGTPLTIKRVPPKKTLLNQYTTHNPQVATNFGLSEFTPSNSHPPVPNLSYGDASAFAGTTLDNFNNPVASASGSFPVLTPGIKVIQPPQFGEAAVGYPSNPSRLPGPSPQHPGGSSASQKATIRDILEQDCPGYETIGYCESPPRYPMHQISIILKKCASLMDVMTTPMVINQQEYNAYSERRSDVNADNTTISDDGLDPDKHVVRKRAAGDGVQACRSDPAIIEPGYAKEETSGRWFVIVQHPEVTQQKIATDTCRNPGKPCGGLAEIKCLRSYPGSSTIKSTKCLQKYAYHKLISWDPDAPDTCPRMRSFKFPSACVCHVGTA